MSSHNPHKLVEGRGNRSGKPILAVVERTHLTTQKRGCSYRTVKGHLAGPSEIPVRGRGEGAVGWVESVLVRGRIERPRNHSGCASPSRGCLTGLSHELRVLRSGRVVQVAHRRLDVSVPHPLLPLFVLLLWLASAAAHARQL